MASLLCGLALGAAAAERAPADHLLDSLAAANDRLVEGALAGAPAGPLIHAGRVLTMAAAHTSPRSTFHHDDRLIAAMANSAAAVEAAMSPNGLWSLGNIESPPDSSFALKALARGQHFLERDNQPATEPLRAGLKRIILAVAEAVRIGGVHTPNHRWAICAALAHVNRLYPDPRYVLRIDEWLAEGIDVDADGLWAERSPNYTSEVNHPAFVDLAVLLDRPELLEPVRRSLDASLFFFEPDGEVEAVASRRQDQRAGAREHAWSYYYAYRYLAVRDRNGTYAAVARWIEREFLPELGQSAAQQNSPLALLLDWPEVAGPLPPEKPLPAAYAQVFPLSAHARFKRGPFTATVFGGTDWYAGLGVGSGISSNPTFFKLRKGAVILDSVRMTPAFFSTGFFLSQGLRTEAGSYVLWQDLDVPYHHPLPADQRRADGQYPLEADMGSQGVRGRFFSRMAFAERPKHFVSLRSRVTVSDHAEGFDLHFEIDGQQGVGVTIELAFRAGGTLTGVLPGTGTDGPGAAGANRNRGGPANPADLANTYLLKEGHARYQVGADYLDFGPGTFQRPPGRMEGETFTWIGGNLRAEGERVYLTGVTPFRHTLTFR